MDISYAIILPILLTAVAAIIHVHHLHRYVDAVFLSIILLAVTANAIASHNISYSYIIKSVSACMLVPACYMYFSHQIGRPWSNNTVISGFALIPIALIPRVVLHLDAGCDGMTGPLHCLSVFAGGRMLCSLTLEGIVIVTQALIVLRRLLKFRALMKRYDLIYSRQMKIFITWSVVCVGFALIDHTLPVSEWFGDTADRWLWYGVYVPLCCVGFAGIAHYRSLQPILYKEDSSEVQMDRFIASNVELAQKLRRLFDDGNLCMRQGLVIDDVVEMLGTNRTYFTRMMRVEFGMSFTEYMHHVRLEKCKSMMLSGDCTLEDIALETGYGSASQLLRVFKKYEGVTPDVWRKAHRRF